MVKKHSCIINSIIKCICWRSMCRRLTVSSWRNNATNPPKYPINKLMQKLIQQYRTSYAHVKECDARLYSYTLYLRHLIHHFVFVLVYELRLTLQALLSSYCRSPIVRFFASIISYSKY